MDSFRKAAFINTIPQIINYGLPLIIFFLLVRSFDIAAYGMWIEGNTIVALLSTCGTQGLLDALGLLVIRNPEKDETIYSNALYTFLGVSGLLSAGMVIAAPLLNTFTIRDPLGIGLMRVISPQVLTGGLIWLSIQILRMRQQPIKGAVFEIIVAFVRLGAVIFAFIRRDLILFAAIHTISQIVIALAGIGVAFRGLRLRAPSRAAVWEMIRYGTDLAAVSQANWLVMFGDRLMLSIMATSVDVALYSAYYQLALVLVALGWPYLYALLPALGERWKAKDDTGIRKAVRHSIRSIMILLIPGVVGLTLSSNALLRFLATQEFLRGGTPVGFIALGVMLYIFAANLQYVFYTRDQSQVLRRIYVGAAVFNVAVNLVAIPLFGYYGAAIVTLLTFLLSAFLLWKNVNIPLTTLLDFSTLWRCILLSAIMGIWVVMTVEATWPRLLLAIGGGTLIYGLGLLVLRVITLSELRAVLSTLSSRKS